MTNLIIDAISIALNSEFGDDYEIHTEEIRQGLKEPCFLVICLNSTNKLFRGKRYFRTNQFCIHFLPEADEAMRKCHNTAERMRRCLEHITIEGECLPIRGTGMQHEVIDGVLYFYLNYDFFVSNAVKPQEAMEGMTENTCLGGD